MARSTAGAAVVVGRAGTSEWRDAVVMRAQSTFGALLRHYREAACLTQQALAEQAQLSTRAVSDLERGVNQRPRLDTVTLLAAALQLSGEDRARFVAAARGEQSAPAAVSANLILQAMPAPLTPIIGREREEAAVVAMLRHERHGDGENGAGIRLLTLTGPGGVGKTRLAVQVATHLHADYTHGSAFVPLALLDDAYLVAPAIAQTLGLRESGARPSREMLIEYLRDRQMLLLLDNFEQVTGAANLVVDLVAACPRLTILVTSRAVLKVRGEQEYALVPLALPDPRLDGSPLATGGLEGIATAMRARLPDPQSLTLYPAVDLFLRRVRAVMPEFTLTPENAAAVVGICARLDGLPLAIELAAARMKLFSPQALLARLERRLQVLTGGARDLPERQQTLRRAIAWSYDLLDDAEQALARRLAVFAGGCALDAVESVCASIQDGDSIGAMADPLAGHDVLEALASLIDKSLLWRDAPPQANRTGEPRVRMLETIREYALERLEAAGEATAIHRRHAAYYLALAEAAESELVGAEQGTWLDRLEADHDNLRAVLRWTLDAPHGRHGTTALDAPHGQHGATALDVPHGQHDMAVAGGAQDETSGPGGAWVTLGLRLAGALPRFWYRHGHLSEGRGWLEKALAWQESAAGAAPATVRAKALYGAGWLAYSQSDYARATARCEHSLALYEEAGDTRGIAAALNMLGNVLSEQGEYERPMLLYARSLALRRELGDAVAIANSLNNMGILAREHGEYERALALYEESLALRRPLGDTSGIAGSLNSMANIAHVRGDYGHATALFTRSLALYRAVGDRDGIALGLLNSGRVACDQGDYARAAALTQESLAIFEEMADRDGVASALHNLAQTARDQGYADRAAALARESHSLFQAIHSRSGRAEALLILALAAYDQGDYERAEAPAAESLELTRQMGDPARLVTALTVLGEIERARGALVRATALLEESLALCGQSGQRRGMAQALEGLAAVASGQGAPELAARLWGQAEALREAIGAPLSPADHVARSHSLSAARAALGAAAFAAAWAAGRLV